MNGRGCFLTYWPISRQIYSFDATLMDTEPVYVLFTNNMRARAVSFRNIQRWAWFVDGVLVAGAPPIDGGAESLKPRFPSPSA
jgi:hypothetical protein